MKPSEMRDLAKRQAMQPKPKPIMAGDHLAGDQFARPEWRERIERGDPVMSRLGAAHRAFHDGHKHLRAATEATDPALTPDANFLKTKKLGEAWLKSAGDIADRAMTYARQEIEAEQRALVSDLGLIENHRAGEIRALVREMDDQRRQEVLGQAVANRDAQTIAAISEAPAYLSGMTPEQAARWRRQYELRNAPERTGRIDTLRKAVDVIDRTINEAIVFNEALHPSKRAAEIEAKQKAARDMQARVASV
jgi:hypothetical protein